MGKGIRTILRWALSAIGFALVVILALNLEKLAEQQGLDDILAEQGEPLIAALSTQWFALVTGLIVGAAIALWLDVLAKRLPTSLRIWRVPLERIEGRQFINSTVELDGKAYIGCYFRNVTLVYNGGRTEFKSNTVEGMVLQTSDEKASRILHFAHQSGLLSVPALNDQGEVPILNTIGSREDGHDEQQSGG